MGIWVVAGATSLIYYNLPRLTLIGPEMTDMIHSGPVQSQATVSWASLRCVGRGEEREGEKERVGDQIGRERGREGRRKAKGRERAQREKRESVCITQHL